MGAHGFRPAPVFWNGGVALGLFRWRSDVVDKIVVPTFGPCAWLRTEVLRVPEEPSRLLGEMLVWQPGRLVDLAGLALAPVQRDDGTTS
ncbi:hypothetical protein [Saccharothrix obliqua]|uniref:hypothetical protein n=1 Tax=Saccharothrix obliqua TaxID=2861747 RepID=UPI001C5DE660|nr:hypothetical protein [Saccharothrix obliqua]MBW4722391.1 hypothetical protein [Saccharothrix obliqua]